MTEEFSNYVSSNGTLDKKLSSLVVATITLLRRDVNHTKQLEDMLETLKASNHILVRSPDFLLTSVGH